MNNNQDYINSIKNDPFLKSKYEFVESYMNSGNNPADSSKVDANANVMSKNVATLSSEIFKEEFIKLNRYMMYKDLKEMYDEEVAEEYLRQLNSNMIYKHDESAPFFPYCVSITMYPFLLNGLQDLGGEAKKPKHLESFVGSFINLVYMVSGQFAGALATPELFLYINYFATKEYGRDYYMYDDIKRKIRKLFEQIVYSINAPATARSYQSVFWNISLFDKPYFKSMFGNFTFPDGTRPEYESFNELQKIFMDWFQRERERALITFPVITMAMVSENGENKDEEFEDWVSECAVKGDDFFIYQGEPNALSSCCFTGDTEVMCVEWEIYKDNMEDPVLYKYKIEHLDNSYNFAVSERIYDKYSQNGFYDKIKKAKLIKTKPKDNIIIEFILDKNRKIKCTKDHIFPVLTIDDEIVDKYAIDIDLEDRFIDNSNSKQSYINIILKKEIEYNDFVYCFEILDDDDNKYFDLGNGILTHNCRLKNEIEDNTFSYSLGAGGVATGSLSVLTLNMPHFIQMNKGKDIKKELEKQLDYMYKFQMAYKKRIEEFIKANLLPVYDAGYIQIDKQFLTIGINGIPEGYELHTNKRPDSSKEYLEWVKSIFETITNKNTEARKIYGHRFNTELVPAENVAVKFAQRDFKQGLKEYDIYSSYFYKPEDEDLNIGDKFILHGELGKYMDGGVALHLNLKEPYLTKEQFKKHLKIASKIGLNYWTWNVPRTYCEKCGKIVKRTVKSCPNCNGRKLKYATRVIGFLKFIENFSEGRRKEANKRIYH